MSLPSKPLIWKSSRHHWAVVPFALGLAVIEDVALTKTQFAAGTGSIVEKIKHTVLSGEECPPMDIMDVHHAQVQVYRDETTNKVKWLGFSTPKSLESYKVTLFSFSIFSITPHVIFFIGIIAKGINLHSCASGLALPEDNIYADGIDDTNEEYGRL